MRLIPRDVIRHCGQRAAQRAVWADGQRVTRRDWQAIRYAGFVVQHIIRADGLVVVTCLTSSWYGAEGEATQMARAIGR